MRQWNIQRAIFDELTSYPALTNIIAQYDGEPAVYDDVPQDAIFPYVVIGDDTALPFDDDMDTGTEATITIHSWSRAPGRGEIKQIQDEIYNALHRNLFPIDDVYTIECHAEYQDTLTDPDGITRHGVQRFRLLATFRR